MLIGVAVTVPTHRCQVAVATTILTDLSHTLLVPGIGAAPGILIANTIGHHQDLTARGAVGFTAISGAYTAIFLAVGAVLIGVAIAIAASWTDRATATAKLLHLVDALLVPSVGTAPGIRVANASLDARIVTT